MTQYFLPGFLLTDAQTVTSLSAEERVIRAIELIRFNEPDGGYYLAFSGGKDSCAIDALAKMAGVRYEKFYNNVTIDPPELVRWLKKFHPDAKWNNSQHGNMFDRIANAPKVPPTRQGRWCCEEYKEIGGRGRIKIMGVRAAESPDRKHNWREIAPDRWGDLTVCPIVYWTDEQLWDFVNANKIPYCPLYDEPDIDRIGCVGCMLQSRAKQDREFKRWPHYEKMWKKAIVANWERWHSVPREKDGMPRYHAKFKSGEEFWEWWRNYKAPDVMREDCQTGILWTNE